MLETVRALDAAGLTPIALSLREPTLDDVFLTLTGHRAEEPAEGVNGSAEERPGRGARGRQGGA
jgi:hypothetical protein